MGVGEGHWAKLGPVGLTFFGDITSSTCHEIKNNLAILNEQAGLIGDLLMMVEKGRPLDTERIKGIAQGMRRQVVRADQAIGRLSRFAHSADNPVDQVELSEILSLVEGLSQRFASLKQVRLKNDFSSSSLQIRSMPFFLLQVIFICLEQAMEAVGKGGIVAVRAEPDESGSKIVFSGDPPTPFCTSGMQNGSFSLLLTVLGAKVTTDRETGGFVLHLPKNI
jgi:C4-dicarboxylate-specific signal transduction histidine kinase